MGRKAKWSGDSKAIRVPAHLADRLLAQAQAWDAAECPETLQVLSPVNPYRVEFESVGEKRQGKVVGVLVDWANSGVVSAVLVDVDASDQQTQVPIDRVRFLDLPDFVQKRVGASLPLQTVTIDDNQRYRMGGFYCPASDLDTVDRLCDALIDECETRGVDPQMVWVRLCEAWLEPLEKSA